MKRRWTDKEDSILREMFADTKTVVIARKLRRSYGSVAQHATVIGLKKSEGFLRSEQSGRLNVVGKAFRFKKGSTPWNKGKKYNPGGRSVETRFKKGMPFKGKSIYYYVDKNGKTYKHVRVAAGVRRPLHQVVWSEANGPIPAGHIVTFIDGNTMNCELSNLKLITRRKNMLRNSVRYPAEINKAVRQINKLKSILYGKENTRPTRNTV